MTKKIDLKKITLGANLIAMAFILAQINQKFLSGSLFSFKKMPIVDAQLWVFWHFPLFVLMFLFSFKYALTFLLIYLFFDGVFYSSFQYLQIYNTYQTLFVDESAVIFKNIIFGTFIPILAYLFLSFLKIDEKNYQKMLLVFIIIIIIQSISRTINGYAWLTIIKTNLPTHEGLFANLINAFFNGGTTKSWFILWFLNLIPVITSNVINLVVFLLFRNKIQTIYQQFNFNEKHS
ncbi:hypothetical protein [Italian clover phyllody phytoplasma]|uniref:hypothetical protein n=1 Tax=Italian clover phyllody phytoplasma TaxID=1196420 RepID=UPI0002F411BE|nr:hypothetical protein [Italian clover phyllody phytoplasma]